VNSKVDASIFSVPIYILDGQPNWRLDQAVKRHGLLGPLASAIMIDDLSSVRWNFASKIAVVIWPMLSGDLSTAKVTSFQAKIEEARALTRERGVLFVGLLDAVEPDQHIDMVKSGFDMVGITGDIDQVLTNVFSLARWGRDLLPDVPVSQTKSPDRGIIVDRWIFQPLSHQVVLPTGKPVSLTEREVQYLHYLIDRDVKFAKIEEFTERAMQDQNERAIVYKLKKKLGADFPIMPTGNGRYILRV